MNPEQEPDITDKSDIDPSIDPKVLVEQEGDDVGRIATAETTEMFDGTTAPQSVEGLPVIGAEAENEMRDNLAEANSFHGLPGGALKGAFSEAVRDMGGDKDKAVEAMADKAGTEAMAAEVSRRASELAKEKFPLASQDLIDQFAKKAAEKFKAELESKNAEKKAEHDQGVMNLMNSLDSPDKKLSEVVPDVPEAAEEDTGYIDTTIESPTPGHN